MHEEEDITQPHSETIFNEKIFEPWINKMYVFYCCYKIKLRFKIEF